MSPPAKAKKNHPYTLGSLSGLKIHPSTQEIFLKGKEFLVGLQTTIFMKSISSPEKTVEHDEDFFLKYLLKQSFINSDYVAGLQENQAQVLEKA